MLVCIIICTTLVYVLFDPTIPTYFCNLFSTLYMLITTWSESTKVLLLNFLVVLQNCYKIDTVDLLHVYLVYLFALVSLQIYLHDLSHI